MKKTKKIIVAMMSAMVLSTLAPTVHAATPSESVKITREYFADGSYIETKIAESNARSTVKNASKTSTYKNASGVSLWYAKVTANFYFDGSTSSCTSASASAGTYVSGWKILSKSSSRTGNTGSATVEAGIYMNGIYVDSIVETVTISCDKNGNVC